MQKFIYIFLAIPFLIGLLYLVAPGPSSINDFADLPQAIRSQEAGDTWQNPNNKAYYSDYYRDYVTEFYKNNYQNLTCCKIDTPLNIFFKIFPPLRLNRPPEEAFQYIRDQQQSTFLEEYTYPLRDSLFVNGYEPYDQNGKPFNSMSKPLDAGDGVIKSTKTTLRYYSSPVWIRLVVYILAWACLVMLIKIAVRSLRGKNES